MKEKILFGMDILRNGGEERENFQGKEERERQLGIRKAQKQAI